MGFDTWEGTAVGPLVDNPAIDWGKEDLDCLQDREVLDQSLGGVTAY